MLKCLMLASDLFIAIRKEEWDRANEIVEELQKVLSTYKDAC